MYVGGLSLRQNAKKYCIFDVTCDWEQCGFSGYSAVVFNFSGRVCDAIDSGGKTWISYPIENFPGFMSLWKTNLKKA
jgi:hypothetical protein